MKSIRNKLAIATCTLLSQGAAHQATATESSWTPDISYLFYSEADRVTVHKIITNADVTLGDNSVLSLEAVYDTITGATPTGAVRQVNTVSVTTPSSGGNGFKAASGTPDLALFDDTRLGVNVNWTRSHSRTFRMNYGASVSVERDYEAYGGSLTLDKETSDRNFTFTAGIAGSYDTVFQSSGQTPKPLGDVEENNGQPEFFDAGNKRGYEGMLGISRVINRHTIAQFNYTIGSQEGYLTDPYKLISKTDDAGREINRYYEKRPNNRLRQTLYSSLVHRLGNKNTIRLSYRFYWDDWDIKSHTIDYRHRRNLADGHYLEPHLRLYHQTAANFFYHSLKAGDLPEYASADYRLDEMNSLTLGAKYGLPAWGGALRFRVEYLYQSFSEAEYDTNKAVIFQISYKKEFD